MFFMLSKVEKIIVTANKLTVQNKPLFCGVMKKTIG